MKAVSTLLLLAVLLWSAGLAHAEPSYKIMDITPTGYTSATAFDINSSGDAVGVASVGGDSAFFYYDHSTGTSTAFGVGTLNPRSAILGTGFREAAINDDGLVAGTAMFVGGAPESRGFIYDGSAAHNLGTLFLGIGTGSNIRPDSDALDINSAGVATGTATSGRATGDNTDIYTSTIAATDPTDIDGDLTAATRRDLGRAINDAGLIAGSNQDSKATLFMGGTETVLLAGTAFAGEGSTALDLNESGQVVVEASVSTKSLVYHSTSGTVTEIPQIGTGVRMFGKAINEEGDVVGWGDIATGGTTGMGWGFVTVDGESYVLFDQVVDRTVPDGTEPGDWGKLGAAWGVNDNGWIVGRGFRTFTGDSFPTGRAYLLIPVPEPAGVALLASGFLLLRRRAFRL